MSYNIKAFFIFHMMLMEKIFQLAVRISIMDFDTGVEEPPSHHETQRFYATYEFPLPPLPPCNATFMRHLILA